MSKKIYNKKPIHLKLENIKKWIGFATEEIPPRGTGNFVTRTFCHSEQKEFYLFINQISSIFLNKYYFPEIINNFLIILHQELTADIYINNVDLEIKFKAKRDIKRGEVLKEEDLSNIESISFSNVDLKNDDNLIFLFRRGWRFGLFFDLSQWDKTKILDFQKLYKELGEFYKKLVNLNINL